jgi:hypothetical protein
MNYIEQNSSPVLQIYQPNSPRHIPEEFYNIGAMCGRNPDKTENMIEDELDEGVKPSSSEVEWDVTVISLLLSPKNKN